MRAYLQTHSVLQLSTSISANKDVKVKFELEATLCSVPAAALTPTCLGELVRQRASLEGRRGWKTRL